jgi:hypothetical protein
MVRQFLAASWSIRLASGSRAFRQLVALDDPWRENLLP